MHASRFGAALAAVLMAAGPIAARDWFVRAGAGGGDGTREKPFADPWQALDKCEAGDAIHVTEGEYGGRLDQGFWVVPFDRVQLIGGYDAAFQVRDPWKHLTRLVWKQSKNRPTEPRVSSQARDVVLDGLVLDSRLQNAYVDDECTGRKDKIGYVSIYLHLPGTVRNCVVINPGLGALQCQPGSVVENNLFLNAIGAAIEVRPGAGDVERMRAKVRRNTILFSWDDSAAGKGGTNGTGIRLVGGAEVSGNILAHCDNNAIDCTAKPEKVAVTGNLFYMNLWGNLRASVDGNQIAVDDKTMDMLEEMGLAGCEGNAVGDPGLAMDPAWIDLYSQRTSWQPGKLVMDDWNQLRRAMGLPLQAQAGQPPTNVAPAYALEKALLLLEPKSAAAAKVGARRVPLQPAFSAGAGGEAPAKAWEPSDLTTWANDATAMEGKAVELIVGVGNVANASYIPDAYKKQGEHAGVSLYDRVGKGVRILGFYRKGTSAERLFDGAMGRYQGQGLPDRLYRVRGVVHALPGSPRAGVFVESVERWEEPAGAQAPRPPGRDWFVRAGASGGDGSREKPWKDPFQALERCESGDTIHVAEGEYVGKLKCGQWKIDCAHVAMLGGYDPEFKERDPWKRPTRLLCPPDFKGRRGGITLEGAEDHSGFVLDGFVFDKRQNNLYADNGDLDKDRSDKTEHVWLSRPGCVIRNCVFLNGAGSALRVCNGQTIENNIIFNHVQVAVDVSSGHTPTPLLFKGNTVAFSWDIRFGNGHGANGTLVRLGGRAKATFEGNVFEFADNDAIVLADPQDVRLVNNVFAHNLWSNVSKHDRVVDDQTFAQLEQMGLLACEGNQVLVPGLPLDQKWFDCYLGRTAYVPGKVTMDDWNKLRELMGQPLVATGGKMTEGFAPVYEWQAALKLFPGNPACKAGARPVPLPVKFEGIVRQEPVHEYAASSWEVAADRTAWDALDGKRVALTVGLFGEDNQWQLPDVPEAEFLPFKAGSPTGDGGLPIRCYVKRGTRHERAMRQGSGDPRSKPESTWVLKGIARANRQMVVESVERAE